MARLSSKHSHLVVGAPVLLGGLVALCLFDSVLHCAVFILLNLAVLLLGRRHPGAVAVRAGTLSACYLATLIALLSMLASLDGGTLEEAIIGESDGLLYHSVADDVSRHVSLWRQFTFWDPSYLIEAGWRNGGGIKDPGFFWLLGVFYTVVGAEAGPEWVAGLNALGAAFALSSIFVAITEGLVAASSPGRIFARSFVAAMLFFGSSTIMSSVILTVRKDVCILVLLVAALIGLLRSSYVRASLGALLLFPFRASFLAPLALHFLLRKVRRPRRMRQVLLLAWVVVAFGMPAVVDYALGSGLLVRSVTLDSDLVLPGLSMILLQHGWLNWIYLALTPVPPVSGLFTYAFETYVGALLASLSNLLLLASFIVYLRRHPKTTAGLEVRSGFISAVVGLYAVVGFQFVLAASLESYYIAEPRYKLAIWALQSGMAFAILRGALRSARTAEARTVGEARPRIEATARSGNGPS